MLTVSLTGIRMAAPVGLYPQEFFTGNQLEIDVSVAQSADLENLPFIDYAQLHGIVQSSLKEPAQLLETLLQRIGKGILLIYPMSKVSIAIRKLNPPMGGEVAFSEVKWES
jgi:dihydroneopterin aldolase